MLLHTFALLSLRIVNVKRNDFMISARLVIKVVLLLLLIAMTGMTLEMLDINFGRYFAYVAIPIGTTITILAAILAMLGKVDNDLH